MYARRAAARLLPRHFNPSQHATPPTHQWPPLPTLALSASSPPLPPTPALSASASSAPPHAPSGLPFSATAASSLLHPHHPPIQQQQQQQQLQQQQQQKQVYQHRYRQLHSLRKHHHQHQQQLHVVPPQHHHVPRQQLPHQQQPRRAMFIQTLTTPNPASLMFLPGRPILSSSSPSSPPTSSSSSPPSPTSASSPASSEDQPSSQSSIEFSSARAALASPLAIALFRIDGVARVFLGGDFVTVTKTEESSWDTLKPEVFAALMDFFASGQPVLNPQAEAAVAAGEQPPAEDESETVLMIRELLETRIRPAVQEDGGDIDFVEFDESSGIVYLRMKGACSGCPSSSVTLKSGVENMLMHYIPEVTSVKEVIEEAD